MGTLLQRFHKLFLYEAKCGERLQKQPPQTLTAAHSTRKSRR